MGASLIEERRGRRSRDDLEDSEMSSWRQFAKDRAMTNRLRTSLLAAFGLCSTLAIGETLHGPHVNPSNMAVLVEWEKATSRQADLIGDSFSANTWSVFEEAYTFETTPRGAIAEQLRRWQNAFDGNQILEASEGDAPYAGKPRGELADYVVEVTLPMFPNEMKNASGELTRSMEVLDRWAMSDPTNRHHAEARRAFRAFARALVAAGLESAHLRLGWEFTGDWFPWGIDPKGGAGMGTPEQFKEVWKFIYLTMEEVNPQFSWVWCGTVGFNHFDPAEAFPEYPSVTFRNREDNADKVLVDYIAADVYDADGECYFKNDNPQDENYELTPGYWNTRSKEQEEAYKCLEKKIFEGKGPAVNNEVVGLRYYHNLAVEKKLPFRLSEWGPWANYVPEWNSKTGKLLRSYAFGGDDNPYFIDGLFRWLKANDVYAACLFEFYNGGQGDIVDHTLLRGYWNSEREKRPRISLYPADSPYGAITDQLHPRAGEAYLKHLREIPLTR